MTDPRRVRTSRGADATARNTFDAPKTITFAMIELSDPKDVNDRRSAWMAKNYRYRDVTPVFNSWSKIPSLNGAMAVSSQAVQSLEEMKQVDADWYMLSGHHGRLYAEDMNLPCFKSGVDHTNRQDHTGFFNDDYHHGRWEQAVRRTPATGADDFANWNEAAPWDPEKDATYRRPNFALTKMEDVPYTRQMRRTMSEHKERERYLSCTGEPTSLLAPFATANPVLEPSMQAKRASRCKGVILAACNTLIYRQARITWHRYFPKAVIIGTFGRIATGAQLTNAIYRSETCNKAFWEDPGSVLKSEGDVEALVVSLVQGFRGKLAVLYDGKVVTGMRKSGIAVTESHAYDVSLSSM